MPIKVTRLAHVGIAAKDLNKQTAFYSDTWGLDPIDEHGKQAFLRGEGPEHHIVTLTEGDGGLDHFAFHVAGVDEIERAADELNQKGIEIVMPPTKEPEPGVARAIRFKDPDGNIVELVAGVDAVSETYGARDVKPQALNHVVLNTPDRPRMEAFYRDVLGLQLSDNVGNFMTFWRCDPNHHSLALASSHNGETGWHHAAFEVKDWQEFMKAVFAMGERKVQRQWGPGRHVAGNNLFSYYFDPEGNVIEYTAEVEQITDPNYVAPVRLPTPDVPNITDHWGSRPPGM